MTPAPSCTRLRWVIGVMVAASQVSESAWATSCSLNRTVDEVFESDVVFVGEFLESHRTIRPGACVSVAVETIRQRPWTETECFPCAMSFKVVELLKGSVEAVVWVDYLGANGCPSREEVKKYVPDLQFLVFPYRTEHHRSAVNMCWGLGGTQREFIEQLRVRRAIDASKDRRP